MRQMLIFAEIAGGVERIRIVGMSLK